LYLCADRLIDALIELGAVNLRHEGSRAGLRKDTKYVMSHFSAPNLQASSESLSSNLGLLFTLLRRNHIQLPSNTFLLLKTIIMAQGLGKGLDPDFNIIPMLESNIMQMIQKRFSIITAIRKLPSATAEMASLAAGLPQRLDRMLKTAERGEIQVRADVSGIEKHIHHLEQIVKVTILGILGAALILGLALFFVGLRLGQ
jgi:ubiquinone biosynthesis protein